MRRYLSHPWLVGLLSWILVSLVEAKTTVFQWQCQPHMVVWLWSDQRFHAVNSQFWHANQADFQYVSIQEMDSLSSNWLKKIQPELINQLQHVQPNQRNALFIVGDLSARQIKQQLLPWCNSQNWQKVDHSALGHIEWKQHPLQQDSLTMIYNLMADSDNLEIQLSNQARLLLYHMVLFGAYQSHCDQQLASEKCWQHDLLQFFKTHHLDMAWLGQIKAEWLEDYWLRDDQPNERANMLGLAWLHQVAPNQYQQLVLATLSIDLHHVQQALIQMS